MESIDLAEAYLTALESGELARVLALFADGGEVYSPLYGPMPAAEFYRRLFADSDHAGLKLRGSAAGSTPDGRPLITIWFHFDWTFADGGHAPFEVVDVMELDEDEKITKLHIIYDTVEVRPAFEHAVGRVSWRPGLSPLV